MTTTTASKAPTMKAAILLKTGDPKSNEVVVVKDDVPIPTLKKNEILVEVSAVSVNPVDWKVINGEFPTTNKAKLLGCDVSGIVKEIAPGTVTDLVVGDEIYADSFATQGSWAEYVRVQAVAVAKKPNNIDMVEAASMPLVALTALQGLKVHGNFKSGQKVLISGGSGGVGSMAVQMAKALGASAVWATGSSVEFIQGLGADHVINYKEESIAERLKGQELDLIFDTVGGVELWKAALQKGTLKKGGRYITIVGDSDNLGYIVMTFVWRKLKGLVRACPSYNIFMANCKGRAVVEDMKQLTTMVETGKVKPVLDARGAFKGLTTESVHAMIEASMSGRAKGKLVLQVKDA